MAINHNLLAIGTVAVAVAVAGAYNVGTKVGEKNSPVAQAKAAPVSHGANPAQPAQEMREGKVQIDPSHAFTHFRVGNKNVKSIYADGKVMWIGTSGGVVRYDTKTDNYKLYDVRNGLLSIGMFATVATVRTTKHRSAPNSTPACS